MEITVRELKDAANTLFDFLESESTTLTLPEDYYWHIGSEELHRVEQDPTELSIGQLSEDWGHLRRMAAGESEPLRYQLAWLAAILRAAAEC